uniref:Carbonic anhydrase n=1 Tax=Salvator merianae TaxID=96440 RepID=A0A8D0DQG8_SALMN
MLLPLLVLLLVPPRRARDEDAPPPLESEEEAPGSREGATGGPGSHRHGGSKHWSYADKARWASAFPHCGGHMQSPINIDTASTHFDPQLGPLLLSDSNLPPGESLSLRNNGHTIVLELPENMTVAGGGFPQPYRAAQLHLHWGSKLSPGSEHTVDQRRYAGEIHVVFYNSRFRTIAEAAGERGGLAVLAAFLQVGSEENEAYEDILEHLNDIPEEGGSTSVEGFDIAKLLPESLDRYFRYNGSLTTPPCYQTVNWTVFNETVLLSPEQISDLEDTLWDDQDGHLQSNFRLPQSLHGRKVLASFPVNGNPEEILPAGRSMSATKQPQTAPGPQTGGPRDAPITYAGTETQVASTLRTGDALAVLFAALFGITALAFLLYVRKQRSRKPRPDAAPAKANTIYMPAATAEHAL